MCHLNYDDPILPGMKFIVSRVNILQIYDEFLSITFHFLKNVLMFLKGNPLIWNLLWNSWEKRNCYKATIYKWVKTILDVETIKQMKRTDSDWRKFHKKISIDRNCNRNFIGINVYIQKKILLVKKKKRLKHRISLILVIFFNRIIYHNNMYNGKSSLYI